MKALPWAMALLSTCASAADTDDGYIGYRLDQRGDPSAAVYETAQTTAGVALPEEPDVHLNASVSVGLIDIDVHNLTAKVNLDAQVLRLLKLNAGVDASVDRVRLTLEDVRARVELEARLGNIVAMVDDVLTSVDLNPVIATLGREVSDIVNSTVEGVTDAVGGNDSGSTNTNTNDNNNNQATRRSPTPDIPAPHPLAHNILYSINDYSGQTHTNRVLGQDGTVYDEHLDSHGRETRARRAVGTYDTLMTFTGRNRTVAAAGGAEEEEAGPVGDADDGAAEFALEYLYAPFPGIEVHSWIYVDAASGEVTRTQVVAEAFGGGTSTISNDSDL